MRTSQIEIDGRSYVTCFSVRVLVALEQRGGDAEKELDRILTSRCLEDSVWLLHRLIDAGYRYCLLEGKEANFIGYDELLDRLDVMEIQKVFSAVVDTAVKGKKRTVEADGKVKKKGRESQQPG